MDTFDQIRLWTSFESSPVSVKIDQINDCSGPVIEFSGSTGDNLGLVVTSR